MKRAGNSIVVGPSRCSYLPNSEVGLSATFTLTVFSRKSPALAYPPGLLRCRRFPTHPERLNHRSHAPDEHQDRQD